VRGAVTLQAAFTKVGVEVHVMNFPMAGEGKFALFVGVKPKNKN
jgi:hypothetical protein